MMYSDTFFFAATVHLKRFTFCFLRDNLQHAFGFLSIQGLGAPFFGSSDHGATTRPKMLVSFSDVFIG